MSKASESHHRKVLGERERIEKARADRAAKQAEEDQFTRHRCIWCGERLEDVSDKPCLNPGARFRLYACCDEHLESARAFAGRDSRLRNVMFLLVAPCVLAEAVLLTFFKDSRYLYVPMLIVAVLVFAMPYVFSSYERYRALGMRRTTMVIRAVMVALAVMSLAFTLG